MPLFDYRCRACGHDFEALVRAGHPAVCPACASQDLEQQMSSFAVSSSDRRSAAAAKARHQAAVKGRQETLVKEAEATEHKRHEH